MPIGKIADTDWAWLAGFLDGDGCIRATEPRGENTYFHVRIGFTQKDRLPLDRVVALVGSGNIRCKHGGTSRHHHALVYGNRVSALILEKVHPYLIAKQSQSVQAQRIIRSDNIDEQVAANKELKRLKHVYKECL